MDYGTLGFLDQNMFLSVGLGWDMDVESNFLKPWG